MGEKWGVAAYICLLLPRGDRAGTWGSALPSPQRFTAGGTRSLRTTRLRLRLRRGPLRCVLTDGRGPLLVSSRRSVLASLRSPRPPAYGDLSGTPRIPCPSQREGIRPPRRASPPHRENGEGQRWRRHPPSVIGTRPRRTYGGISARPDRTGEAHRFGVLKQSDARERRRSGGQ